MKRLNAIAIRQMQTLTARTVSKAVGRRDFHGDPYLSFLLGSLNLSRFKTGASVPTLDRNSFKTLPILVPPLPEQKKIAHILSTVQRAIEAQERIIQTTTELKKALMHKLFTEGLRRRTPKTNRNRPRA
jgi:type I restriction enzyme, S subunit